MKKRLLLYFLCFTAFSFAQLPAQWYGHYKGELNISGLSGESKVFPMEFILSELNDSTSNWIIVYGEDSLRQERAYKIIQTKANQFVIDEQNGIVLSCNQFNNEMISIFEVQGNLIHIVYTFEKKKLRFDLTSSTNQTETGGIDQSKSDPMNKETIPIVYTYETVNRQWAELKRIKKKK